MEKKINVVILDDHQSIIDGYLFRLRDFSKINVVATANFSEELEEVLKKHPVNILITDINVPTSASESSPAPLLYLIPKLLQQYPDLKIIVISMHAERALIQAVSDSGASGYILKDDYSSIKQLGWIITSVAEGGVFYSREAHSRLLESPTEKNLLTQRQKEVLLFFASYPQLTTFAAALELNIAHSTVRNLLSDIYLRLDVSNRSSAIIKAQQMGIIPHSVSKIDINDLYEDTDD